MINTTPPQKVYESLTTIWIPEALENIKLKDADRVLFAKRSLYTRYRTLAVLEWHLHQEKEKYRAYLKKALQYERERFIEAHSNNPEILYYCPSDYGETALCTSDFAYAKSYIAFLDDHHDPTAYIREPWSYYVLINLVLGRYQDTFERNMAKLKKSYTMKKYEIIRSEYDLIEAIVQRDEKKFHNHLEELVNNHKPIARLFVDYEDRFLCIFGLALCNLAIGLGMKVDFDHPLIPKALIGA